MLTSTLVRLTVPLPFIPDSSLSAGAAASIPGPFDPSPPEIVTQPSAVIYEESPPAFVKRAGTQLLLDGQPFRFTGFNIFNANNLDPAACWYPWGQGEALDQALTT